MKKILFSILLICLFAFGQGQEVILPLQVNPAQAEAYLLNQTSANNKAKIDRYIDVDLNKSKIIIIDDFSTNTGVPGANYWQENYVYVNNNFAKDPQSIGVATFDGLDETGYPYDFAQPSSYGACDTLTSLPIKLGNVNYNDPDTVAYLSFLYQPQGMNPFANSEKDSIILQFKDFKSKIVEHKVLVSIDSTHSAVQTYYETVDLSEWTQVWGREGSDVHEFRRVVIKVDSAFYKNGFQFRFVSYGNTSGSVDHWHIDNVYMSIESPLKHTGFEDVAYTRETGSQLKFKLESMPWSHYYQDPNYYDDDTRMPLRLYNSYNTANIVTLEYFAEDASGNPVDNITGVPGGVVLPGKDFKTESMPITGVADHDFLFPISSEPNPNATTYFLKRNVMTNPDQNEIIKSNNTVKDYQVFGTYYSYDDGSAEAGYGIRASQGKFAYQFELKDGLTDSILAMYIYFNPVVVNRSTERFKFTIWGDNNGKPGSIIYQNTSTHSPTYPKKGVNTFQRIKMDRPVAVNGTYYIGYEKLTTEVLNIGYDLNRDASDKMFFDIGNGWINSGVDGSVPKGALMLRPSFSNAVEPQVGIIKPRALASELDISLYPNPTRDRIYFESNNTDDLDLEVQIFNLQGSILNKFTMNKMSELDVSHMNPGMYVVQFTDRKTHRVVNKKFIVSK